MNIILLLFQGDDTKVVSDITNWLTTGRLVLLFGSIIVGLVSTYFVGRNRLNARHMKELNGLRAELHRLDKEVTELREKGNAADEMKDLLKDIVKSKT
ncbi:MAG: hypothetical protein HEP71_27715 [Roseivirga sp.]|nr:hypothetical protein [Roseivirga sp.]